MKSLVKESKCLACEMHIWWRYGFMGAPRRWRRSIDSSPPAKFAKAETSPNGPAALYHVSSIKYTPTIFIPKSKLLIFYNMNMLANVLFLCHVTKCSFGAW